MKQTAVEWLFEQIPFEWSSSRAAFEAFEQAKAMDKEQMIKFANECLKNYLSLKRYKTPEQYYNETYNK